MIAEDVSAVGISLAADGGAIVAGAGGEDGRSGPGERCWPGRALGSDQGEEENGAEGGCLHDCLSNVNVCLFCSSSYSIVYDRKGRRKQGEA